MSATITLDLSVLASRLPDNSIARSKLEYPTVDVSFAYLSAINKVRLIGQYDWDSGGVFTIDSFTDKAILNVICDAAVLSIGRSQGDMKNRYAQFIYSGNPAKDHIISKVVNGTNTDLAYEAVNVAGGSQHLALFSISGSTLNGFRIDLTTPKITATDTTFASGYFGPASAWSKGIRTPLDAVLKAPASATPPALTILEVDVAGSGKPEDPFRPNLTQNLVEISQLSGLPNFLYQDARRYEILKNKGFTDDEIKVLLGYIPQHQVDLNAVTWGAFEFSEKSPTNIIVITGDNPYQAGAIDRQKSNAKRSFTPPKSYGDAVALYAQLKNDYPHWLAGKDNFAYQVLGYEGLEVLGVIDFYEGELIDHKTHYDQIKHVPDWELRNVLRMWGERLERAKPNLPVDEYRKHRGKLDKVMRLGW